jgi:hypothetical protein
MSGLIALPIAVWPEPDRAAWQRAIAPATSLFDTGAAAAKLRPRTIAGYAQALGNWFGFLQRRGELEPRSVLDLVTPERLDLYVEEQRSRGNRDGTIAKRLEGLHAGLKLIAPLRDYRFILRPGGLPLSRALPFVPRPVQLETPEDLLGLALALYREGRAGRSYAGGRTALRDAALIGILATRAPRIGSVAAMQLGRHLQKRGETYWVWLEEQMMKGGNPLGYALPTAVTPLLDAYLISVRPAFGGNDTPYLWLGPRDKAAVSAAGLAKIVCRRTKAYFGTSRGPHWIRKCLTTAAALDSPERALDVCTMLSHSPAVALKYYNAAGATVAGRRHDQRVSRLQERTRQVAIEAFRQAARSSD